MLYYSVIRIENGLAVCEDDNGNFVELQTSILPSEIHEGSMLILENGTYSLDTEEEMCRRRRAAELMNSLWEE